ncbi:MAG: hypothetical protein LKF52_05540 [Butyrivibrio sp.]|nr:hypothetical protein [Butyrivibrio sp.]
MRIHSGLTRFRRICALITAITVVMTPVIADAACPITVSSSQSQSDAVTNYYNLIPSEIRTAFETGGWTIEIEGLQQIYHNIGGIPVGPDGYSLAGITIIKTRKVCLNSSGTYSTQAINHEMGHYFDYLIYASSGVQPSVTPAFTSIYQKESVGGDRYISSNSTEYFADAFKRYLETPKALQQSDPQTYNYVSALVTNYVAVIDAANAATSVQNKTSVTAADTQLPEKDYPAGTFIYNGLDFGSVFNPEYYYNHNPDLQKAIGYNPQKLFQHFIQYGVAEGRAGIG